MLEKVELHNFKSHRATQLSLDNSRLHALVGQNSSGKTSVLQALYYLGQLNNSSFQNVFGHQRAPEFIATVGQNNLSVNGSGFWGYSPQWNWSASYTFQKQDNFWLPTASWKEYLRERGSNTGLTAYLHEIEQRLVPVIRE